ncbi:2-isopropylmalate synthase [Clostridium acetireducens DSM 10703]|uniref:2-isopropylmalate synthase n=2 Tax=Clostridium TaxID=1485 RepID=A0A1E8EX44_9CLOT|nr:2-isopropylmalate synthase [Clostridium acetireducens DSM 10703]
MDNMNTNMNKKSLYNYGLQNIDTANLYKGIFPYDEIPKIRFNNVQVPMDLPEKIWITDTTFRDGQQSMPPYTAEQIARIYDYLHQLDNNSGIIKQTEFFLYTEKDRKAVEMCMEKGYEFPQITSWIRANKEDFKLVKQMGIKETGMLMSCSDYHIFKKLNMSRKQAADMYISLVEEAFENGIVPRCHLEDITRADFYGFVVPFVSKLVELSKEAGIPVKIRACDTLGVGVSYQGVELPRSVPAIIHGLRYNCGVPSECIEWHGHNDFYSVVTNSTTSWLYGGSSVNTSLLGIGERTGNCPLESMIFEYAQLKGSTENMNLKIITEISDYFEKEFGYETPPRTPFVGSDFNVTRAGIHADGILKDEEIYNAFNTEKVLGRPIVIAVNQYSGLAGIAAWINTYYRLKEDMKIDKNDSRVHVIKEWVDEQYACGRTTIMRSDELENMVKLVMPEITEVAS